MRQCHDRQKIDMTTDTAGCDGCHPISEPSLSFLTKIAAGSDLEIGLRSEVVRAAAILIGKDPALSQSTLLPWGPGFWRMLSA